MPDNFHVNFNKSSFLSVNNFRYSLKHQALRFKLENILFDLPNHKDNAKSKYTKINTRPEQGFRHSVISGMFPAY